MQRSKKFQTKVETGDVNMKFFQDFLQRNKHFHYSFMEFLGKLMNKDKDL